MATYERKVLHIERVEFHDLPEDRMIRSAEKRHVIDWAEYEHFRGYGWDVARVAEKLGVSPGSLKTALGRRATRAQQASTREVAGAYSAQTAGLS